MIFGCLVWLGVAAGLGILIGKAIKRANEEAGWDDYGI